MRMTRVAVCISDSAWTMDDYITRQASVMPCCSAVTSETRAPLVTTSNRVCSALASPPKLIPALYLFLLYLLTASIPITK